MSLRPKGIFILFTGLPCAGKTTIARALEKEINAQYFRHDDTLPQVQVLDGDVLRTGLCSDLKFSREDRKENLRRVAEVAKILMSHRMIVLGAFVSPYREERAMMREIVGEGYYEVFVDAPLSECEDRDVKGMYAKARAGEIKDFTGIDDPYESPHGGEINLTLDSKRRTVHDCVQQVADMLIRDGVLQ